MVGAVCVNCLVERKYCCIRVSANTKRAKTNDGEELSEKRKGEHIYISTDSLIWICSENYLSTHVIPAMSEDCQ